MIGGSIHPPVLAAWETASHPRGKLHLDIAVTGRVLQLRDHTMTGDYLHTYEYFIKLYRHTSVYKAVIEPLALFRDHGVLVYVLVLHV